MREIIKVMLQEGIDEETIHEVLNVINEVKPEDADNVSNERYIRYHKARERYKKDPTERNEEYYVKALIKNNKNEKLRDKWDVFKGLKRDENGEFRRKDKTNS